MKIRFKIHAEASLQFCAWWVGETCVGSYKVWTLHERLVLISTSWIKYKLKDGGTCCLLKEAVLYAWRNDCSNLICIVTSNKEYLQLSPTVMPAVMLLLIAFAVHPSGIKEVRGALVHGKVRSSQLCHAFIFFPPISRLSSSDSINSLYQPMRRLCWWHVRKQKEKTKLVEALWMRVFSLHFLSFTIYLSIRLMLVRYQTLIGWSYSTVRPTFLYI